MPVYNGARFLRQAIDSVLSQSFHDLELLVVDDGSTDDSVAIANAVADPRLRCVAAPGHRGLVGTLNIGLRAATGEYVARLDADDVARPDRIAKQAALLDREPKVAVVGSLARLIDDRGAAGGIVRRPVSAVAIRWYALLENPLIHSAAMFRRDVVSALGGYDESLPLAEDYDLWGRILPHHAIANIDECLIDYRRWSASVMAKVEADARGDRGGRLQAIMAALVKRHVNNELGSGSCNDEEAALLAGFTFGVAADRRRAFLDRFTAIRRRFEAKWPAALTDGDYWRTLADQYDAIAFRMSTPSRPAACDVYLHAINHAPRTIAHLPWMKALALIALGKAGRDAAGSIKRTLPQ
jgi:glycosyltransferase involved in cell wall biosynthesis